VKTYESKTLNKFTSRVNLESLLVSSSFRFVYLITTQPNTLGPKQLQRDQATTGLCLIE